MIDTKEMPVVCLQPIQREQGPILTNLVELYCHDLSDIFGLRIGLDGRYQALELSGYWEQPEAGADLRIGDLTSESRTSLTRAGQTLTIGVGGLEACGGANAGGFCVGK